MTRRTALKLHSYKQVWDSCPLLTHQQEKRSKTRIMIQRRVKQLLSHHIQHWTMKQKQKTIKRMKNMSEKWLSLTALWMHLNSTCIIRTANTLPRESRRLSMGMKVWVAHSKLSSDERTEIIMAKDICSRIVTNLIYLACIKSHKLCYRKIGF